MSSLPFPKMIADVTPAWLNATLADDPDWIGRRIVAVDPRPIGGQDSLASAVYEMRVGVSEVDGPVKHASLLHRSSDGDERPNPRGLPTS